MAFMGYKAAFKASTTSLNSNGSRCSTDMMPSHARAEETAEVESKGKSKRSGSSRVKKTSFFGSFYKLHSSSREDADAKKHKSSESARKKAKHSLPASANGVLSLSARSSVEVDVEPDDDDDDRPTRRFTFSTSQRDVTREASGKSTPTSPVIKQKQTPKRKTGAISALLFHDAQVFGAVSLPNLADAMTSPVAVQDDDEDEKTRRRRRKAEGKLEAYRHRMYSHGDKCGGERTSSVSSASCDDGSDGAVTSTTRSGSDVHISTLSPVILRMRRDAITAQSFSSNSSLSSTGSAPICDVTDMLSSSAGAQESRRRVSMGRRTHLSVAERDERARSLGSECIVTSQTSGGVGLDQPVVSPAFAQASGLDSDYRQRLLTAPPALMRPYRRAFRLKSGQRHAVGDAYGHQVDEPPLTAVGRCSRDAGSRADCAFRRISEGLS